MAKSPRFAWLWLSPLVIKMFAQVPARAINSFYQVIPPSWVVLSFIHSQRFSCQDPGGGWTWHGASHTRGVEERLSTQFSTRSLPHHFPVPLPGHSHIGTGVGCDQPCLARWISYLRRLKKEVRKIRGVGRVCFSHLFLRFPSWDKKTSPKKRHTHFALEVMLK